MNGTIEVPTDIYSRLLSGFIARQADIIITDGGVRGNVMVDDATGEVLAWLWRANPGQCMIRLADLIAELRIHHLQAPEPPIRLSDVIDGLLFGFPSDFSDDERSAFAAAARSQVAGYYGPDPDA